jgi:membrane-bound lytic murein transglycosylase D
MKSSVLLSLFLFVACARLQRPPHHTPASVADSAAESRHEEIQWSTLEEIDEEGKDGHALVEEQAPEETIAQAVGGDVDSEIAPPEAARPGLPFLKKVKTKRVKFWVDYFTQNQKSRERFQRFLNNGELYRPIIEKIFDEQGVPRELFYVGLIESGYYLGAHSHAAAVGPWQFIRGTGLRYGMTINRDLDERRDIFKATVAAAQYFKDLNNIFSSWELALAAYNAGEYGIIRRITRHKTRDYYELSRKGLLPKETINYVPKVLAAMHVTQNAESYGFTLPKGTGRFWQKTKLIRAPKGVALSTLAHRLDLSPTLLTKLNPELRQKRTPRSVPGAYYVRVPADKHTEWMETLVADENVVNPRLKEIEALKDKVLNPHAYHVPYVAPRRQSAAIHKVRRGETLSSIARRHRLTLRSLARANNLSVRSRVRVGQRLRLERVPAAVAAKKSHRSKAAPVVARSARHAPLTLRVGRGDTLTDVSRWFGVSVAAIKQANGIKQGRSLHAGKKIKIPNTRKGSYTVRRGEGLIKVASKFGLQTEALVRLNNLKRRQLYAGQRLVVNVN